MNPTDHPLAAARRCLAFDGVRRIAAGDLRSVATKVKTFADRTHATSILIFDEATSELIELDLRGSEAEVLERLAKDAGGESGLEEAGPEARVLPRGPGRPKLGVVAREVTLLPRHWEWLGNQPGGASVALRRLVEFARRDGSGRDAKRRSQETAYRFMVALAGDNTGFEEATRALFAGDSVRFASETQAWPKDVRDHARTLAEGAFAQVSPN